MATEKRYIEVNALMEDRIWKCGGDPYDPYYMGYQDALDNVEVTIENQPTVDAVEVVHGEWSIIEDDYDDAPILECSVCEMSFRVEEYDWLLPQAQTYHYCPNCGAKMDGDGNG